MTGLPVTAVAGGLTAAACVTVLPDASASAPSTGPGICAAGPSSAPLTLGCTPSTDECQGVYAVSVALVRSGLVQPGVPLHHLPHVPAAVRRVGDSGLLRVGVVVPVTTGGLGPMADTLTDRTIATWRPRSP